MIITAAGEEANGGQGGGRVGSDAVLTVALKDGHFVADGAKISGTIKCDRFRPAIAEGGN